MKRIKLLIIGILLGISSMAQSKNDGIIGNWFNEEQNTLIHIYEENGKYFGKIVWLLKPFDENGNPKTDPLNDDESLRNRPRMGMVIMYNFEYDGNNEWDDGNIYDPSSGNEYSGSMKLTSSNKLDLRGYVGFSWLGRTTEWTRKN